MLGCACASVGAAEGRLRRRSRVPSPPPPRWCARADTGRGGGVRVRACPPLMEQLVSRAAAGPKGVGSRERALDGSTRHPNSTRGRRRKSARAVLARAPHPRAVPVSASPSRGRRVCPSAGGRDANAQEGLGPRAPGIRGSLARAPLSVPRRGRGPASERASGAPPDPPCKGWSGAVGWRVRTRSALAARPRTLDERAVGFAGWARRVEPSLGK